MTSEGEELLEGVDVCTRRGRFQYSVSLKCIFYPKSCPVNEERKRGHPANKLGTHGIAVAKFVVSYSNPKTSSLLPFDRTPESGVTIRPFVFVPTSVRHAVEHRTRPSSWHSMNNKLKRRFAKRLAAKCDHCTRDERHWAIQNRKSIWQCDWRLLKIYVASVIFFWVIPIAGEQGFFKQRTLATCWRNLLGQISYTFPNFGFTLIVETRGMRNVQ